MRGKIVALALAGALATAGCQQSAAEAGAGAAQPIRAELDDGNYGKAAELAAAAVKQNPTNPELHLLQARAEARLGNAGDAARALERAILAGLERPEEALADPAFDSIRRDAAFQRLADRFAPAPRARPRAVAQDSGETISAGDVEISGPPGEEVIRAGDIVLEAN
ncbi:tetratricopeptide repeat protein [Phenylobacterium sp.]|uniref:TPR end-of-group domain-containing protein n=1 Tax=Phenylobacterium sp. TaxID=1871053 RepID=UPI0035B48A75